MVVRNNISALNSHRNLGINNNNLSRNLERLSSGFRINRASDDAAGLAISERMRGQIRGLAMAEQNTNQGINLIQTAEGGLQETQNLLQRMRELAVMSSNGTFTDNDRAQIHHEIAALADEIDRIASSTHYNGINLLDGSLGSIAASNSQDALGLDLTTLSFTGTGTNAMERLSGATDLNVQITATELMGTDPTTGGQTSQTVLAMQIGDRTFMGEAETIENAENFDFTGVDTSGMTQAEADALSDQINTLLGAGTIPAGTTYADLGTAIEAAVGGLELTAAQAEELAELVYAAGAGEITFDTQTEETGRVIFRDNDGTEVGTVEFAEGGSSSDIRAGVVSSLVLMDGDLHAGTARVAERDAPTSELVFQIGANGGRDQRAALQVGNMSTAALGFVDAQGDAWTVRQIASSFSEGGLSETNAGASILMREGSNVAVDILDSALDQVSGQRAQLGALQNRLESTLNSLGVARENLTAAESTIRDVDMAAEMMQFTQNNILTQAAQAMLAQANQLPQGVLQLLG